MAHPEPPPSHSLSDHERRLASNNPFIRLAAQRKARGGASTSYGSLSEFSTGNPETASVCSAQTSHDENDTFGEVASSGVSARSFASQHQRLESNPFVDAIPEECELPSFYDLGSVSGDYASGPRHNVAQASVGQRRRPTLTTISRSNSASQARGPQHAKQESGTLGAAAFMFSGPRSRQQQSATGESTSRLERQKSAETIINEFYYHPF